MGCAEPVLIGSALKLPFLPWVGQIYIGRWASFTSVATFILYNSINSSSCVHTFFAPVTRL
ncbi:hypothetical protein ACZ87_03892 [Candidatus Erwinia dacicola]|uniref:Uncharacterized protein n=1 Tax=Candidatus Erwinia dacicola TaxID=252393 RepID=A0A328TFP1_9GAMM|nr:hypothetical protein ACZ87_03892 [Candidatus Erwinia dacicola]